MTEIQICCGLGDCLIYCQIYELYRSTFKYTYVLSPRLTLIYRNIEYVKHVQDIFNLFNVPLKILDNSISLNITIPIHDLLLKYPINKITLTNYIKNIDVALPEKYIVLCLNYRYVDNLMSIDLINNMIDKICYLLNNNIFKLPIVIIGHRNTYKMIDVTNYSIYNKLNISKFIDKSYDGNLIMEPNLNNLLYDINILQNAQETFQLGFGGSLVVNCLFSKKVSSIIYPENEVIIPKIYATHWFNLCNNITIFNNRNKLIEQIVTYKKNIKNILYILGHKTLIDFEVPILIKNDYGVLIAKKYDSLNVENTLHLNSLMYDYSLNIDNNNLDILNNIDWYSNKCISQKIIDILNTNFKYIILTLLTSGDLLTQLCSKFNGVIFYRFFGMEDVKRYKNICITHPKIKYIFSYPEIYKFEKSFDNFFNDDNSYIIPLGVPDNIIKYKNTYNPIINKVCFICSKINICPYYTNIYKNFITNFKDKYDYVLLGKNNETLNDNNKLNNLNDENYYKKISECKLMYYHSTEPRHLHYHPLEGIVIGIPIIFYNESLLSSYLNNSPGKCNNINEVYNKINKILNNDIEFINSIINEQNKVISILEMKNNMNIFKVLDTQFKQRYAFFLSHNGLGDNITNTSAIHYLLNYYETIYFLCKDIYVENVNLLFTDKPVITIPVNSANEHNHCKKIINSIPKADLFISGNHTSYLKSRITHPSLLKHIKNNGDYSCKYTHITQFYNDNGLDLSIYFEYFNIESSKKSIEYYEQIKQYKIVFLHTKGSKREINLDNIVQLYNTDEYIIICANKNVYALGTDKYELANKYINIYVAYYIDIIKNAEIIHVIDSCFSCIIYPLITTNKISPKECKIYDSSQIKNNKCIIIFYNTININKLIDRNILIATNLVDKSIKIYIFDVNNILNNNLQQKILSYTPLLNITFYKITDENTILNGKQVIKKIIINN